jgi:hypothetical protein
LNRIYELVRQIWKEERILEEWKETIVVPIHKRWDRNGCDYYRGIGLGNAVYKILSNIIPYIEKIMGTFRIDSEMEDL